MACHGGEAGRKYDYLPDPQPLRDQDGKRPFSGVRDKNKQTGDKPDFPQGIQSADIPAADPADVLAFYNPVRDISRRE